MRRIVFILCLSLLPGLALARDQIRVVGSSTVYPFTTAAAEQFGREGSFRTPIVESTGTGGGFKMFCDGTGSAYPDIADASRPIKPAETDACAAHGVKDIREFVIGYDGIVVASASNSPDFTLSRRSLFLALAREVPRDGKLVPNFYTRWKQIDPSLPDVPIEVYGPPPAEGTRDALSELLMEKGCANFPEYAGDKKRCTSMREDGPFIEVLGGNVMIQKILADEHALAIFGYNYLAQNATRLKAAPIDGVAPSPAAISDGKYSLARDLYIYVKGEHLAQVPGLADFVRLITSDAATGEEGYLILKGLLPLPAKLHDAMKAKAAAL